MAYQSRFFETMLVNEGQQVLGHGDIVVAGIVGRFSVVSQILHSCLVADETCLNSLADFTYHRVYMSLQVSGQGSTIL
jgi:hypothetical protein